MKILEAPSEVPDDAQVALKSETSHLDQEQKSKELEGKSQKESEPDSTLTKRERCDINFSGHGKVHVRYHRDKIGMSPDADRVPCNERLYPRSYRNIWDPDEDDKLVYLAMGCSTVERENIKETSSGALCKLLHLQAAPEVDMEQFDGNPMNYHYFIVLFAEVVERKIEEPRGRLTRPIKFTTGEARELTKHCIQLPHNRGYQHARTILERTYGNPHKILSSHRKEIKELSLLKFGDAKGFCKFYNFLLKSESVSESQAWNALGTPEMLCMLISKLPGGLMDRWNKTVQAIRRKQIREPDLQDLIQFVEEETTVVSDLLFSREALHEYTKGPGKQNQRRLKQMKKCFVKTDKNKDACESL